MALKESEVGPADELTWGIDWTKWLDGRNIQSSDWTVVAPVVKLSQSNTTKKALVKLRVAGAVGGYYEVVNEVTADDGEKEQRRLAFKVVNR